jgi:hypothetical protein
MPKGIYDRPASAWTPPLRADDPPELVERVREVYGAGHSMRETAEIVGVSVKVLQRLMPRHGIPRRRPVKRSQTGPSNTSWRGDAAGYQALHLRVATVRGKPSKCKFCGRTDDAVRYEWANLTGNFADPYDYDRLCVPCHRRFDAARRSS